MKTSSSASSYTSDTSSTLPQRQGAGAPALSQIQHHVLQRLAQLDVADSPNPRGADVVAAASGTTMPAVTPPSGRAPATRTAQVAPTLPAIDDAEVSRIIHISDAAYDAGAYAEALAQLEAIANAPAAATSFKFQTRLASTYQKVAQQQENIAPQVFGDPWAGKLTVDDVVWPALAMQFKAIEAYCIALKLWPSARVQQGLLSAHPASALPGFFRAVNHQLQIATMDLRTMVSDMIGVQSGGQAMTPGRLSQPLRDAAQNFNAEAEAAGHTPFLIWHDWQARVLRKLAALSQLLNVAEPA